MFLRIAPELYLKRLLVGGFDRVFEINRNFRNEGISVRHNPEFTMMEFYAAYWNHHDLMDFTENVLRHAARAAAGTATLSYAGKPVDLDRPFARLSVRDALVEHAGLSAAEAGDAKLLHAKLKALGEEPPAHWSLAELQFGLFEAVVEAQLWQPTFIIDYPVEVSPLARASDTNPAVTERFELFITGREMRQRLLGAERRRRPGRTLRTRRRRTRTPATRRRCTTTPTSSARSSTACRPPAAAASASTA